MNTATDTGQDQSAIFRGTASDELSLKQGALKDERSVVGTPARAMPAFILGEELAVLAQDDERIVVMTADLASANRTSDFKARFPDRFFNFGIAERNMITAAAGMAASGMIPYAATFASFCAILAAEPIRTACAYPNLPVRIVGHHSGMSMGFYGTSHHALEDFAIMRALSGLTVVAVADANQLKAVLRLSLEHPGAMYIRLGRGRDPQVYAEMPRDMRIGKAITLREGNDLTIIATGSELHPSLQAAEALAGEGVSVRVVDMHTLSPLDREAVERAASETGAILTVEEHNVTGGLGSAVAEILVELPRLPFRRHGVPDEYVLVGPPAALYAHYRLDCEGIASVARELLGKA